MPGKICVVLATAIAASAFAGALSARSAEGPQEAPSGFDNATNGYVSQAEYDTARIAFEKTETVADGLGPLYNAQSCATCHASPITGGASQVVELRAGHIDAVGRFVAPRGGSLIHDRAIAPGLQAHVSDAESVRAFRLSSSVLGLGFIEAIDDGTFIELARRQAIETGGRVAGQIVEVPVLEADGTPRVGRFGWKNQHASLLSFAADAYVNELGITNRLAPLEVGLSAAALAMYDLVPDPEDGLDTPIGEQDIDRFATFVRATKAPAPDAALAAMPDARIGAELFRSVGCAVCHVPTLVTASAGTLIDGGTFVVPPALGSKVIHPFSDFLLHDIGTGDGIPQGSASGAVLRTPPLWGLRTHSRLMHDGLSLTPLDAVLRHRGEALNAEHAVRRLQQTQLRQLLAFLRVL
jgi:CxxC motif-containing protein (DUF1111 family)